MPRTRGKQVILDEELVRLIRQCYGGEALNDAIRKSVKLRATADGYLTPDGRFKGRT